MARSLRLGLNQPTGETHKEAKERNYLLGLSHNFFFNFIYLFIYFGCVGFLLLHAGFL